MMGLNSEGKIVGFRVEYDERIKSHINVFSGKEKGPHFEFDASEKTVKKIQKNIQDVLNIMDRELKNTLENNKISYKEYDIDFFLSLFEKKYPFCGSKIDWKKVNKHETFKIFGWNDLEKILYERYKKTFNKYSSFYYFGDNLTDDVYEIPSIFFVEFIKIVFEELPHHHYILLKDMNSCLCISMENYIDYGEL